MKVNKLELEIGDQILIVTEESDNYLRVEQAKILKFSDSKKFFLGLYDQEYMHPFTNWRPVSKIIDKVPVPVEQDTASRWSRFMAWVWKCE